MLFHPRSDIACTDTGADSDGGFDQHGAGRTDVASTRPMAGHSCDRAARTHAMTGRGPHEYSDEVGRRPDQVYGFSACRADVIPVRDVALIADDITHVPRPR